MSEQKQYKPDFIKVPPPPPPASKLTDAELEQRRQQGGNPTDAQEYQTRQLKKLGESLSQEIRDTKQKAVAEHTLWDYWKLADWGERFGMISFLSGVFLFGYLCSKMSLASRVIDLIRDVTP